LLEEELKNGFLDSVDSSSFVAKKLVPPKADEGNGSVFSAVEEKKDPNKPLLLLSGGVFDLEVVLSCCTGLVRRGVSLEHGFKRLGGVPPFDFLCPVHYINKKVVKQSTISNINNHSSNNNNIVHHSPEAESDALGILTRIFSPSLML
jgi:hypothetical protein